MGVYLLPLSPNDRPTTAKEFLGVVGGDPEVAVVGPNRGANLEIAPAPPPSLAVGSIQKKKKGMGPGSESTHSGGYRPTKFCPQTNRQTGPKRPFWGPKSTTKRAYLVLLDVPLDLAASFMRRKKKSATPCPLYLTCAPPPSAHR